MSTPIMPQRPARSQPKSPETLAPSDAIPKIPPRPQRHAQNDASTSPERDGFTRSPLNESPFAANIPASNNGIYKQNRNSSSTSLPPRPPSVPALPMIGQEGIEYASLENSEATKPLVKVLSSPVTATPVSGHRPGSPTETRIVAGDLPLHAPKASLPAETAAGQMATITRTDSRSAASAGIGRAQTEYVDHHNPSGQQSSSRSSQHARPPSTGHQRPPSVGHQRPPSASHRPASSRAESIHGDEDEHGIPEIGLQVPMYPNAGDVQAPSPAQAGGHHPPGIGFFNDGRRKSGQAFINPPGSYGLHGHGVIHQDQFEKSWYQKHPDELVKEEHGAYGPAGTRSEWALTSEQLNQLVRASSSHENSVATNAAMMGIPSELIAHAAAEAYAIKYNGSPVKKPGSGSQAIGADGTLQQDGRIHVDEDPYFQKGPTNTDIGKISDERSQDHKGMPYDRRNSRTPILASDEIAKDPHGEWLHPAVTAEQIASDDAYYSNILNAQSHERRSSGQYHSKSRPNSRPNSVYNLSRYSTHEDGAHTPLEEIEEYEPLFKDDELDKPKGVADRLRRPELEKRFPSLDVWEDTPTSLQLETTVEGPQEPLESATDGIKASTFESPDAEAARRGEITESQRVEAAKQQQATRMLNAAVEQEVKVRPGLQPRFPSLDVWEDSPDSLSLTTTVDDISPEGPTGATQSISEVSKSPPDTVTPIIPARPIQRSNDQAGLPPVATETNEISPIGKRQIPQVPDRPKPKVPVRPARSLRSEGGEMAPSPLAKSSSVDSVENADESVAPAVKAKPAVPSKVVGGSKVAQMRAGFMNDLNNRLQLGPQAVPKVQTAPETAEERLEEERGPLSDARKGRARGPTRRKPAASPEKTDTIENPPKPKFSFWQPQSVWQVGNEGTNFVHVFDSTQDSITPSSETKTAEQLGEEPQAAPLATNTAGERLISSEDAPKVASGALAHPANAAMDERAAREEAIQKEKVNEHLKEQIGSEGDVPEPSGTDAPSDGPHEPVAGDA